MLIVETIAKIRRLHFTEGKGIKTICRDLNHSQIQQEAIASKLVSSGLRAFRSAAWTPLPH